ncbi:hypothetical protein CTEN210_01065 [Chaetoceros tenuissimus]|uniref:Potassium channel tetramerisation-type BTB domain-containing protein n=1 Tax=Chaetoceros tenuissimus TaxID=426638 RepID=A0AAD3CF05_9STRA|nr:hypothetical protein CTEN210_01065 [Chaetoceros tenuissimus]
MSATQTTIKLNFPGSLLERCASKTWNEGGKEVFIEGDGTRFRQVLDYMRHGEVTLPRGESTSSFLKELEYYGIEYDKDKIINSDDYSIPSFIPFSQSFVDDKHSKTLNYVAAVIASDIISEAANAMIADRKRSFKVHYTFQVSEDKLRSRKNLEKLVIVKYLVSWTYDQRKEILDSINDSISRMNLKISKYYFSSYTSWFEVSALSED